MHYKRYTYTWDEHVDCGCNSVTIVFYGTTMAHSVWTGHNMTGRQSDILYLSITCIIHTSGHCQWFILVVVRTLLFPATAIKFDSSIRNYLSDSVTIRYMYLVGLIQFARHMSSTYNIRSTYPDYIHPQHSYISHVYVACRRFVCVFSL